MRLLKDEIPDSRYERRDDNYFIFLRKKLFKWGKILSFFDDE